jgi:acyl-CoA synthetase (NDP forming)
MRDLTPLLRPRSIAMIGASSDPTRSNGRTLRYLLTGGFDGPVHAVNPRRKEVQGLPSWQSIRDIPGPVDAVIVALPAPDVAAALRDCGRAGARSAIVFAGGFAESGAAGLAAQQEVGRAAAEAGLLLLGPNSLGAYDARSRSFMTFSSMFEEGFTSGGRIGMVTQSGGWGSEARKVASGRGMSIVQWVSTGNECDIDAAEVLHAMAQDPDIDVVLMYLEGIRQGKRLHEALEVARRGRKVVAAIKVGRTVAGQAAAASHTASMTGEDKVFDAICRHYGVHRADSIEELLDVAYVALLARQHNRMPAGPATVILSPSGGFAVHMTDQLVRQGLELPPLPAPVQARISERMPNASVSNPVDLTGQVLNQLPDFGRTLDDLLGSGAFDAADIYVGMAGSAPALRDRWIDTLAWAAKRHPGRWLGVSVLATPETTARYEAAGYAVFADTARMVNAHAALVRSSEASQRSVAEVVPRARIYWPADPCSEVEAKRILATIGIPSPREAIAANADEAARMAVEFGTPVAVKVVSPDITHKTDVGGVRLGLDGADAVHAAVSRMDRLIRSSKPEVRIDGYLVSAMVGDGTDCMLGLRHDPDLGPVVVFGAGGVMAEWLQDIAIRVAPVDLGGARALIADTRISRLLAGWRGAPAADVEALAGAIVALAALTDAGGRPRDVEINPLRVMPKGQGVLALDALITNPSLPTR